MRTKTAIAEYLIVNAIILCLFYEIGVLFYMHELMPSANDYSLFKYFFIGFGILYLVLFLINGKIYRNTFGSLMNIAVVASILNTWILIKKAGIAGIFCIALALITTGTLWLLNFAVLKIQAYILISKAKNNILEHLQSKETANTALNNSANDGSYNEDYNEDNDRSDEPYSPHIDFTCVGLIDWLKDDRDDLPKRKISSAHLIFAAFFIPLFVVTIFAMSSLGIFDEYQAVTSDPNYTYYETTVSNADMAVFKQIEAKYWQTLNTDSKIDLLQKVVDREAQRLGIPHAPTVVISTDSETEHNDISTYNTEENLIMLAPDTLGSDKDGYNAVRSVVYHTYIAYQNAGIELLELINANETTSQYANLPIFFLSNRNDEYAFKSKASTYSELVGSEYRRKILLYCLNDVKDNY